MVRMGQRLLAFVLAFVVVGAPVASDVCQATCARHPGHSSHNESASHRHHVASGAEHSAHHHEALTESPASTNSLAMIPVPHVCDHVDAVMPASRESMQASAFSVVPAAAGVVPVVVRELPPTDVDSRHGPPGLARSIVPLRI